MMECTVKNIVYLQFRRVPLLTFDNFSIIRNQKYNDKLTYNEINNLRKTLYLWRNLKFVTKSQLKTWVKKTKIFHHDSINYDDYVKIPSSIIIVDGLILTCNFFFLNFNLKKFSYLIFFRYNCITYQKKLYIY